jgi:hypothetical protein
MVTRIDRLARSIGDLQDIVRTVRARGAVLKATEQPIDTGTAAGKCFLDMLGVFAEFETNLRRERQLEGIAKAQAAGVYKGRPASIEGSRVREPKANGCGRVISRRRSKLAARRSTGCWQRTNCGTELFGSCRVRASRPKSVICIHTTCEMFSSAVSRRPWANPARQTTVKPCASMSASAQPFG